MTDTGWLARTEVLIGKGQLKKLTEAHVLVVGLGGVGSYAAEFLCRAGIGELTIVDGDVVENTNRNRQLQALSSNIGESKAELMAKRLLDINPELKLHIVKEFIMPGMVDKLFTYKYNYVIDAIDSITPKITFISFAYKIGTKIVSSMGAGGKFDPTMLKVTDLSETYNCPFAQQIRKNLKSMGITKGIKAVFSPEKPLKESIVYTDGTNFKKSAYGTISYMPATFGSVAASVVIRDLLEL